MSGCLSFGSDLILASCAAAQLGANRNIYSSNQEQRWEKKAAGGRGLGMVGWSLELQGAEP